MKYFDYESVAREAKIPAGQMRRLLKIIGGDFPNDPLMRELRVLRASMAIKEGRIRIDDVLKNQAENHSQRGVASHAELNEGDPLASAILLAKSDKEDGRLEVKEIFGMDLRASLVVLSACETGLGKLSSGDELVGLTRAFIYGTRNLASTRRKLKSC